MAQPRVAVDAMGGDHGPAVAVAGALLATAEGSVDVALVGPGDLLRRELRRLGAGPDAIEVVDAPDVVAMGEKVSLSTVKKRSSIQVALERVREGAADAFFSAGNTAACWTIAKMVLGTLPEVDRPALAAVVPNASGRTVLLDVGANSQCKARNLGEFAIMGSAYARGVLRNPRPRVGLMSVGEEATKGHDLVRDANELLESSGLNFVGNVEGHDVFSGKVDVVVMDGFTGNVVLKASETCAAFVIDLLRQEVGRDLRGRLGGWLLRPAFRAARRRSDPGEVGGAPLLGVKGCCVIGHGKSDARSVMHGVKMAAEFHASGVNAEIEAELRVLGARKEAEA